MYIRCVMLKTVTSAVRRVKFQGFVYPTDRGVVSFQPLEAKDHLIVLQWSYKDGDMFEVFAYSQLHEGVVRERTVYRGFPIEAF